MSNKVTAVFDSGLREVLLNNPISIACHEGMVRRYYPFHRHDYYEISMTFRGQHSLRIGHEILPYGNGDICIIAPDTLHSVEPVFSGQNKPEEDLVWVMKVSPELVPSHILKKRQATVVPMGENKDFLSRNLELLMNTLLQEEIRWPFVQSLTTIILEVVRLQVLNTEKAPVATDASDDYLREILDYISEHYKENLTVESLTNRFHMSRSTMMRMFQDNLGITPINYRIDNQIQAACDLLNKTSSSVQDVSEELGFNNVYYFSSLFSKRMHTSPNRFRHQYPYEMIH